MIHNDSGVRRTKLACYQLYSRLAIFLLAVQLHECMGSSESDRGKIPPFICLTIQLFVHLFGRIQPTAVRFRGGADPLKNASFHCLFFGALSFPSSFLFLLFSFLFGEHRAQDPHCDGGILRGPRASRRSAGRGRDLVMY